MALEYPLVAGEYPEHWLRTAGKFAKMRLVAATGTTGRVFSATAAATDKKVTSRASRIAFWAIFFLRLRLAKRSSRSPVAGIFCDWHFLRLPFFCDWSNQAQGGMRGKNAIGSPVAMRLAVQSHQSHRFGGFSELPGYQHSDATYVMPHAQGTP